MEIRTTRIEAGMTQVQLARAAGVPQPNLSAYENGRRRPSAEVLERIREALRVRPSDRIAQHREEILAVVAEHHAEHPRVFGSIARGEDGPDSDVDLLVDFFPQAGLLDEIGLRLDLSDLLGVPVDVIGSDALRGDFRERVLAEAVPL